MSTSRIYQSDQSYPSSPAGPPPPPKPNISQHNSPRPSDHGRPPPPAPHPSTSQTPQQHPTNQSAHQQAFRPPVPAASQDPGERWVPDILADKTIPDLSKALTTPSLLSALSSSANTQPPSVPLASSSLNPALAANISLAQELGKLESRAVELRSATEAQLLGCHSLERKWRDTQRRMDEALGPFAPPALYQVLLQAIAEQEMYCRAMEESFLDGDGEATDKEVNDWLRSYREARKTAFLRMERKRRWDEGRVGGWR